MAALRLATLNVWGHADWIGRHGEARMRSIGERMSALALDVIALQEVWTETWRDLLLEGGRRAGLVHAWHNEATVGGGGLLVMSRRPILEARFDPYSVCGLPERIDHADYYSGKGFALLRLESATGPFWLVNTHLVAQYSSDDTDLYRGQRVGQIVELASAVVPEPLPVVALGDFNVREDGGLYDIWTGLSGARDVAVELDRRQATVLADNPYREGSAADARIDYGFVRDGVRGRWRPRAIERVFDEPRDFGGEPGAHSDHAGLLLELDLLAEPGRRPRPAVRALEAAARWLDRGRDAALGRQRSRRSLAVGSFVAGCGAAGVAVAPPLQRRTFLKMGAAGAALAGLGGAVGFGAMAEHFAPEELDGFGRVTQALARLQRWRRRAGLDPAEGRASG